MGVMYMVKNLRKLRMSKDISQQRLADILEITQQAVYKYEKDKTEPDIRTLILLADYFDTTVDYLIGHTPTAAAGSDPSAGAELTQEEWALVRGFRQLTKPERDSILLIIKNYRKEKE